MSLLQINGLRLVAGEQTLIHDMDLSINDGEWMTVIGESGSGKTLTGLSIGRLLPNGVRHTADKSCLTASLCPSCPRNS